MSVQVIIERRFEGVPYPEQLQALHDFRIKAMQQKGYIRGETLVNLEDQREVVVLSLWASADHWRAWLKSDERRKLESDLAPYLDGPVKIRIFMQGAEYAAQAFAAAAGGE